jgi:amidophosphoribosyltransferase
MGEFVAFEAAVNLLKQRGLSHVIDDVYQKCLASLTKPKDQVENYVKAIYEPFTDDEISKEIAHIVRPHDLDAELEVIFQTLDNLHIACPNHKGDWYFSGDYPTPGGNTVVNRAFMNWVEGKHVRAYFSR